MKKRNYVVVFFAAVIFFTGVSDIYAAGNKERYIEKRGKFSISIPETWQVIELKGLRYKMLRGAFVNGHAPTINFTDESFDGQPDEYIFYVKEELHKIFGENIELILESEFVTLKGLKGKIMVITTYQQETLIQQSYFCFPGKNKRYLIITCTNLAADHEKYNELFHNTVETFEWLE